MTPRCVAELVVSLLQKEALVVGVSVETFLAGAFVVPIWIDIVLRLPWAFDTIEQTRWIGACAKIESNRSLWRQWYGIAAIARNLHLRPRPRHYY